MRFILLSLLTLTMACQKEAKQQALNQKPPPEVHINTDTALSAQATPSTPTPQTALIPFSLPKPLASLEFNQIGSLAKEQIEQAIQGTETKAPVVTYETLVPQTQFALPLSDLPMTLAMFELSSVSIFLEIFDALKIKQHWNEDALPFTYSLNLPNGNVLNPVQFTLSRDAITHHPKVEIKSKKPGGEKEILTYEVVSAPTPSKPLGAFILTHSTADVENQSSELRVIRSSIDTPNPIALTMFAEENTKIPLMVSDPSGSEDASMGIVHKKITSIAMTADATGEHFQARIFTTESPNPHIDKEGEAAMIHLSQDQDRTVYNIEKVAAPDKNESIKSIYNRLDQKGTIKEKCFDKKNYTQRVSEYQLFHAETGQPVQFNNADKSLTLSYTHSIDNDRNGRDKFKDWSSNALEYTLDPQWNTYSLTGLPQENFETYYHDFDLKDGSILEDAEKKKYKVKAQSIDNVLSISEAPACPIREISIPLENPLSF